MTRRALRWPAILLWAIVGCAPEPQLRPTGTAPEIRLSDVTAGSGLDFSHYNGRSDRRYLPETMGSGAACFDADQDGLPDLYFANSIDVAALDDPKGQPTGRFFRNLGGWRFADATEASGLDLAFLGMGSAVGDLDNDADLDLLAVGVGGDHLFLNDGQGVFSEATTSWGLDTPGFSSAALFLDADRDGFLDVLIGRYVSWSSAGDLLCSPDGEHRTYCTPESYRGATNRFYKNQGGQRLVEATREVGLEETSGKTLGLVATDLDGDGWIDLVAANDTQRNFLFKNVQGRFQEQGLERGIALGASGTPRGAMGIDAGDFDGDGREDLVIGNFAQEMSALYLQSDSRLFVDEAARLGIGFPTLMTLAFGTLAVDLDNDGWLDLVFANGHIEPEIARFQTSQSYAQPLQIFRNLEGKGFDPISQFGIQEKFVGRSLLACDLDLDGDQDLVLTQNGGKARLLRNDSPPARWIQLELIGTKSPRTPYGAVVEIEAEGWTIRRALMSGRSYLVAHEPILTIGLGQTRNIEKLRILWPSGSMQEIEAPGLDRRVRVQEVSSR